MAAGRADGFGPRWSRSWSKTLAPEHLHKYSSTSALLPSTFVGRQGSTWLGLVPSRSHIAILHIHDDYDLAAAAYSLIEYRIPHVDRRTAAGLI